MCHLPRSVLPVKHHTIVNAPIDMAQQLIKAPKVKPYKMLTVLHVIHRPRSPAMDVLSSVQIQLLTMTMVTTMPPTSHTFLHLIAL